MAKFRSRLAIEGLEDRRLLAVNAFFNEATNTLVVQGDGAADTVDISQNDNRVTVRARAGTGLSTAESAGPFVTNGSARFTVQGQFNIVVDLAGGNDNLTIRNVDDFEPLERSPEGLGNVIVETGDGNDRVTLVNVEGDNLLIDSGAGNDAVTLSDVEMSNQLDISTGAGTDVLTLSRVEVGDEDDADNADDPAVEEFLAAAVDEGIFDGAEDVFGAEVGLDISTGDGNDVVTLNRVDVGDNDSTTDVVFEALIDTGIGNDIVSVVNSEFADAVDIVLGAGNDTLSILGSEFDAEFTADGGAAGTDRITLGDNEFALARAEVLAGITGFERSTIRRNEFSSRDDDDRRGGRDDGDRDDNDGRGRGRGGRGRS